MTIYRIRDVLFDPDACQITVDGRTEHVQPQVRAVLVNAKTAVNLVITLSVFVLLLSLLAVAADFFMMSD